MYYTVVVASTPDGQTTVSSDGIVILPVDQTVDDMVVSDGRTCKQGYYFYLGR